MHRSKAERNACGAQDVIGLILTINLKAQKPFRRSDWKQSSIEKDLTVNNILQC